MESRLIQLRGSLWMIAGKDNFGGIGRITLLERIAETGSITQAAKTMKMSYKAAWDAVDMMNNLAGEPLVARQAGGKGGGGTYLTERGKALIKQFTALKNEHMRFIDSLNAQLNGIAEDMSLLTRIAMKTSARNQFSGTVTHIKREDLSAEVSIDMGNNTIINALITEESAVDLNLQAGDEIFALIKSSSVWIEPVGQPAASNPKTHNRLKGVITHIKNGAHHHEVIVRWSHERTACAAISGDVFATLDLSVGQEVYAVFKPVSVIIGKVMM